MRRALPFVALALAHAPLAFAETRELDAHEHGTGELTIAVEGKTVAMTFEAPGFDIVGFEYEAKSEEDLARIAAATETLSSPLALFAFPDGADCSVTSAKAMLVEEDHDDHDDHGHDEDGHDEDAHGEGEDHAHDKDHDHEKDEDHAHDDHDDHGDEDHSDHEASHTAFEGRYELTCTDPSALTRLDLPYFQTFPNAEKLDVQIVTDAGAKAFEATREASALDL